MTLLNLSNQEALKDAIAPEIQKLRTIMDTRKPVWDKLPLEKKKKWILLNKDPIMSLAWSVFKYLRNNFFGEVDDG